MRCPDVAVRVGGTMKEAMTTPMTTAGPDQPVVDDERFMDNVREALTNGYDHVCAQCGIGVAHDDMDMHERGCSEYTEPKW